MTYVRFLTDMDHERKASRARIENYFNINHARETTIRVAQAKLLHNAFTNSLWHD